MAAEFSVLFPAGDGDYQARAARAAFDEADRLEAELSRFRETSDVSRVAALKPGSSCVVGPDFFECLEIALDVYRETRGAFDPSLGRMGDLVLEPESLRVAGGVPLDFGAIGKGYALDRMAALLRDWGLDDFLLQAGSSSALARGGTGTSSVPVPPRAPHNHWTVSLRDPRDQSSILQTVTLAPPLFAIGGSGTALQGAHILDPRTGEPALKRPAAWALAPSAAQADALSTAFMVLEEADIRDLCAPQSLRAVLMSDNGDLTTISSP
jgi:thiamine biosynthesis lipoprotein